MKLIEYIADPVKRRELAAKLGTSPGYLWQMAATWKGRRVPAERVFEVCRHTGDVVTPHGVRPDLYPDPDYRPVMDERASAIQSQAQAAA